MKLLDAAADPASQGASASAKALTVTLAGAGTLSWGGYTANDVAMLTGAVVAVLGLIVQWYYRRDENKLKRREAELREEEHHAMMREHEARMSELRE